MWGGCYGSRLGREPGSPPGRERLPFAVMPVPALVTHLPQLFLLGIGQYLLNLVAYLAALNDKAAHQFTSLLGQCLHLAAIGIAISRELAQCLTSCPHSFY